MLFSVGLSATQDDRRGVAASRGRARSAPPRRAAVRAGEVSRARPAALFRPARNRDGADLDAGGDEGGRQFRLLVELSRCRDGLGRVGAAASRADDCQGRGAAGGREAMAAGPGGRAVPATAPDPVRDGRLADAGLRGDPRLRLQRPGRQAARRPDRIRRVRATAAPVAIEGRPAPIRRRRALPTLLPFPARQRRGPDPEFQADLLQAASRSLDQGSGSLAAFAPVTAELAGPRGRQWAFVPAVPTEPARPSPDRSRRDPSPDRDLVEA